MCAPIYAPQSAPNAVKSNAVDIFYNSDPLGREEGILFDVIAIRIMLTFSKSFVHKIKAPYPK